ncbi:hypothetical protein P4O66_003549 [Electrophorus voltai]|uniref:Endonuclease/exonuclease/phosphatase domain-containing protein n=1 Tax=Electrophorus voltai TaxID=2609070 RepID=A0AAD8ZV34_9TELE|nr:hypothetical protein P4O66_003549 [Electrophorus voltai]
MRRSATSPRRKKTPLFSALRFVGYHHRSHNLSNFTDSQRFTPSHIMVAGGLWNCQSSVQKADFISALASLHFLHFLALTKTWITPENSATPAALSSAFSFTHLLRHFSWGGGTGLLMSREWCFTALSFSTLSISSFEFHAITVSFPTKLLITVIYRPLGSQDHFIDELDILLSQFPIEGNPFILLGDFNLPSVKLHSSCILPMLTAFDLALNHAPLTHKVGNVLDLIFTCTTTTSDIPVSRRISACLTDIASCMTAHNLNLNPSKTEILFIPDFSFVTYEGFGPFSQRKLPSSTRYSDVLGAVMELSCGLDWETASQDFMMKSVSSSSVLMYLIIAIQEKPSCFQISAVPSLLPSGAPHLSRRSLICWDRVELKG